jgi:hypothetical protein
MCPSSVLWLALVEMLDQGYSVLSHSCSMARPILIASTALPVHGAQLHMNTKDSGVDVVSVQLHLVVIGLECLPKKTLAWE